jgi:hypothetical protein
LRYAQLYQRLPLNDDGTVIGLAVGVFVLSIEFSALVTGHVS